MNLTYVDTVVFVADWLPVGFGALFGAMFASFFCVVHERVQEGLSVQGRSRCVCGRQLSVAENLPIVGWVRARGRASCCGSPIPVRYVVAEFVAGLSCAFAAYLGGFVAVSAVIATAGVVVLADARRRQTSRVSDAGEGATDPNGSRPEGRER